MWGVVQNAIGTELKIELDFRFPEKKQDYFFPGKSSVVCASRVLYRQQHTTSPRPQRDLAAASGEQLYSPVAVISCFL
jgi:hypothetical protein